MATRCSDARSEMQSTAIERPRDSRSTRVPHTLFTRIRRMATDGFSQEAECPYLFQTSPCSLADLRHRPLLTRVAWFFRLRALADVPRMRAVFHASPGGKRHCR